MTYDTNDLLPDYFRSFSCILQSNKKDNNQVKFGCRGGRNCGHRAKCRYSFVSADVAFCPKEIFQMSADSKNFPVGDQTAAGGTGGK